MKKLVTELSEKEVQRLIADYPWLLNLDYEIISELNNKGMEYQLSESKRADLVLKDRKSGRPVIVEFKSIPFYRENIGQILEYRARILKEYTNDDSILKGIFEDKMLVPILLLVVPECSGEARLACNLSGIEIYEYGKVAPELMVPERRKYLDEFASSLEQKDLPFNEERSSYVDGVYDSIQELLSEMDRLSGWKNYRKPPGEYFFNLNHLFINKWIFTDYEISIGIFEDVFKDTTKIIFEYYSLDSNLLADFVSEYQKLNLKPDNINAIDNDTYDGSCWSFSIDKDIFLKDVKKSAEPFILNYLRIMKNLKLMG